ncbi:putative deoxyribonuclease tatdn3 isoform X3 [Salmo trutta]|uniref:putative deoxyribonuclease tatdn3 isoform X3 n=1 Tax=Salmo trutta TaxID=8032 RepID=UPI0011317680|nr:putative deoxyribonuclease tatdn3 isoform X3 [Salmo trutta]
MTNTLFKDECSKVTVQKCVCILQDLEDVIKRTREAGVKTLISVTEELSEFERVIQLFKSYPDLVAPCFGIHPVQGCGSHDQHSVKIQDLEPALPLFQKYRDDIVAVGEIGLDFTPWYAPTSQEREEQLTVFTKQLQISKDLDLPVNIHSRSAAKVTIATLKEQGITCALLHNFAGKPSVAMEGVQAGYFFSFPPAVCRNDQKAKLIKQIPLEHICLETDSPALGPEKHVRNEPKNISLVCEYIAHVKGITPQMVIHATTDNALRLFPKIKRLE